MKKQIIVNSNTAFVQAIRLKNGASYIIRANRTKKGGYHERVFELTKYGAKGVPAMEYIMNVREAGVEKTAVLYQA
jgi:hypothetical protein